MNFADSISTEFLTKTNNGSNRFYANYFDGFKYYLCEKVVYKWPICNSKSSRVFIETKLVLWITEVECTADYLVSYVRDVLTEVKFPPDDYGEVNPVYCLAVDKEWR